MTGPDRRQNGFALLIVLWVLALLALLSSFLIAAARDRAVVAGELREAATLEAAADGATRHAIYRLLDQSASRWSPDGTVHVVRIGQREVSVRLEDEAGKVNPNTASIATLTALLAGEVAKPADAAALAGAIIAWRTPGGDSRALAAGGTGGAGSGADGASGRPFRSINELAEVRGMTPELLDRLRPRLTLFTGSDPDLISANDASGVVRIVSIVAVARGPGKAMFAGHVVVRTNARRSGSRYEIFMSELGDAAAGTVRASDVEDVMR
jgi:general secretion pathway protein K